MLQWAGVHPVMAVLFALLAWSFATTLLDETKLSARERSLKMRSARTIRFRIATRGAKRLT
jgi:hypothetical protein